MSDVLVNVLFFFLSKFLAFLRYLIRFLATSQNSLHSFALVLFVDLLDILLSI